VQLSAARRRQKWVVPARQTINVIVPDYHLGLRQSGRIVAEVLRGAGFAVDLIHGDYHDDSGNLREKKSRLMRLGRIWSRPPLLRQFMRHDANIFLERIHPEWFGLAHRQILIPNQEWFPGDKVPLLPEIDLVVCKSRHAEEIFSKIGCRTAFSSFTSPDCRRPHPEPKRREFLLLGGIWPAVSDRVIRLWNRHPEWPALTVAGQNTSERLHPPNVRLIKKYLPPEEKIVLQNTHLFHIAVTAAEGFGHKLNEAMSCGGLVIATDGAPMNELVQPDRGFLVRCERTTPKNLGTEFHYSEEELERAIGKCLRLASDEIERLAANARNWFEQNDRFFRNALPAILQNPVTGCISTGPSISAT
jgi:hypothetical protein